VQGHQGNTDSLINGGVTCLVERIVSVSTENQEKHVQTGYLGLESDRNRLVSPVPLRVPSPPSSFSFPAQGNSSLAARWRGSSSPAWTRGREGSSPVARARAGADGRASSPMRTADLESGRGSRMCA
jgi:hypothetical protein